MGKQSVVRRHFGLKTNDSGHVLFGNEEARMPDLEEISMQPVEEGKESKRNKSAWLASVVEKEMYDHDPISVQAYAVAYFLRWRCTALCDSKTAVLPGDGEQAHYNFLLHEKPCLYIQLGKRQLWSPLNNSFCGFTLEDNLFTSISCICLLGSSWCAAVTDHHTLMLLFPCSIQSYHP